ncbi:lipid-A-disaccharide synthase [Legionella geestiana]|uniref:Lipid-A-disaccharide synthase n=1 Tax=Legionella geestiana TaxID=45065 RepID=A0A0W0TYH7_9GAMM|nr:lipid-A-disaccharide synthase N-terminal domain-containing protein [Legionella geestiana]KTD00672.1 lipid-A-disaccharide synthase [Legionella geestiana]QBS11715.1 lipid A biosynthesis protein [Legionella geestiana]QDQ40673.1 lipid A biosynthesis protein [Legionella geestiana]STX53597.1 lipid-A-disaccharide synthase [Legionella geestiana]
MNIDTLWLVLGLTGQGIFAARFIVQWIVSERQRQSVIPVAFWYLSMLGGVLLFMYAIYKRDPVFIIGQSTGVFVYGRNLWLIHKRRVLETAPS